MIILAIETSCDETSAAVVKDGWEVLSNVIASQIDFHRKYGGIVPELASRKHSEVISSILKEALERAGTAWVLALSAAHGGAFGGPAPENQAEVAMGQEVVIDSQAWRRAGVAAEAQP